MKKNTKLNYFTRSQLFTFIGNKEFSYKLNMCIVFSLRFKVGATVPRGKVAIEF